MLARTPAGEAPPLSELPRRRFRCVHVDPPWPFKSNSDARPGRNARRHYRTMTLTEIAALPVGDRAADDSSLFLWVPGPLFVRGLHLPIVREWGFKPSGIGFVFVKLRPRAPAGPYFSIDDLAMGGGFTTRKNVEICLIGRRGHLQRRDAGVHEVIIAPRREHSRKPDEVYARIQRLYPGPYLDLFARATRPRWTTWGNQVGLFDQEARS